MTDTRETKIDALRAAVLAGDTKRINELQNELTIEEQTTVANRAAEIRRDLARIDQRLAEIKEEQALMIAARAEKNKVLFAAQDAVADAQEAVNRITISFMTSENERRELHENIYAANQQLKWLAEEAAAKFEKRKVINYE